MKESKEIFWDFLSQPPKVDNEGPNNDFDYDHYINIQLYKHINLCNIQNKVEQ